MKARFELRLQRVHDEALAGQSALAVKGGRYHFYGEMGLAALAPAAMTAVTLTFVDHVQVGWRQFGEERRLDAVLAG